MRLKYCFRNIPDFLNIERAAPKYLPVQVRKLLWRVMLPAGYTNFHIFSTTNIYYSFTTIEITCTNTIPGTVTCQAPY